MEKVLKKLVLLDLVIGLLLFCVWGAGGAESVPAISEQMQNYKKIALTFDDGPHPYYTEQLLDGLSQRGVVATFFVTNLLHRF